MLNDDKQKAVFGMTHHVVDKEFVDRIIDSLNQACRDGSPACELAHRISHMVDAEGLTKMQATGVLLGLLMSQCVSVSPEEGQRYARALAVAVIRVAERVTQARNFSAN